MTQDSHADRRVAVITGAAQGLGARIAERLADEAFRVVLLDVNGAGLQRTAETINERVAGSVGLTLTVDLTDADAVEAAFAQIDAEFGRIDALVNTAGGSGTLQVRDIEELSPDVWAAVVAGNLHSAFHTSKYAAPVMRRNGYGRIVNFSSAVANGLSGPSGTVGARLPYAASKAGLIGLTKQLAKDLATSGITVNVVSPGLILPSTDGSGRSLNRSLPKNRPPSNARFRLAAPGRMTSRRRGFLPGLRSSRVYLRNCAGRRRPCPSLPTSVKHRGVACRLPSVHGLVTDSACLT